ncbi:MAG: PA14 domain-containing protein, partial [Chloroflexota bacterium]
MRRLIIAAMIFFTLGVIGWFSPDIQPVQAQGDATWQVQYFDNLYFLGNPVLTETRDEVNLDWGTGSPGSGVPADNFTARVSTDVFFPAGSYRFYMLADDGATVTFNFQSEVIDTFYQPRPGEIISGDITVDRASVYHIQIDYRELEGEAYLYFDYESTADGVTGPDFPPQTPSGGSTSGCTAPSSRT